MDREDVYELINGERDYQEMMGKKYGWGEGEGASNHSIGDFVLMLECYTRKAVDAWCHAQDGNEEALATIRKIAGIAVACMEKHGSTPRE